MTPPFSTVRTLLSDTDPNRSTSLFPTKPQINPLLYTQTKSKSKQEKMSAPKQGRQSPEPESQTPGQVGHAETTDAARVDAAPSDTHAQEASEEHKHSALSSNPEGPLDAAVKEKQSK